MWLSLTDQTIYFLWSLAFGAALGVLYDVQRAVRRAGSPSRLAVLIRDIVFFGMCGLLTSLFAIPFNNGTVRAFIIMGEGIGWLLYRLTVSKVTVRALTALVRGMRWCSKKISELFKKFFVFLLKITKIMVYNVCVIIEKVQHIVGHYKKERVYEQKKEEKRRRNICRRKHGKHRRSRTK